ncbi:hypothetical protein ABZ712_16280 [Streptomyces sp. NPDC006906]|uniref:hypothetical protein n=1 Tax=Streptomyces sp. NPDC006906 TaxID=3154782 RepID=UPI0033DE317B
MLPSTANRDSHPSDLHLPSFWPRVREFAVPPVMIATATARREAGDWAGACAAAGVDVDLQLRSVARGHGRALAARIRADLRHLAPDLLRWHMPRIAPHGLLRPGLTIALARYDPPERDRARPLHLVVRTPPAWADAGQRISLALWDGSHTGPTARRHPHPRPNRRFRLDLHRHLWDARRADELRSRSGLDDRATGQSAAAVDPDLWCAVPPDRRWAVDRWAAEAAALLRAEGREQGGAVSVRLGGRRRLLLRVEAAEGRPGAPDARIAAVARDPGLSTAPVLPDAATWVLPDLDSPRPRGRRTRTRRHLAPRDAAPPRPRKALRGGGLRPARRVRAALRPPHARPPAAHHGDPPGRPVAVAAQLGHDAEPDRLRDRRRGLPGGAVPAGQRDGGRRSWP